jgi:hypothetical protein
MKMIHSPALSAGKDTDLMKKPILVKRFYSVTLHAMIVLKSIELINVQHAGPMLRF